MLCSYKSQLSKVNKMKRVILSSFIIFWMCIYHSSAQTQSKNPFFLPENSTCRVDAFWNKNLDTLHQTSRKWAHDKSRFSLKNVSGHLTLKDVTPCKLLHQNEIYLHYGEGKIVRQTDTFKMFLSTPFDKFYICAINHDQILDSFNSNLTVVGKIESMGNGPAGLYIESSFFCNITAIPVNGNLDDRYKHIHRNENVAIFSWFEIEDSSGKKRIYPPGDFIIAGGNTMKYLR